MDQVIDFFKGLMDTSLWPPRWHCGRWTEFHGWLYIISDLLIFSAYFAMPVIIVRYMATRAHTRFHRIYFLFAAFILACGFTHLIDAVTFWYPVYRFNALIRLITGVISWFTVYSLFRILPFAFSLKTADELQAEIEQRKKVEEDLKVKLKLLNEAQEIARLGHWEWDVTTDHLRWSDNMFRLYGLPEQAHDLSYEKFLQCVHPDDRAGVDDAIRQAQADRRFSSFFHRVVRPDGQVRIMHARGEVITNAAGQVTGMIGTGQDVTEQKSIEQELQVKSTELGQKNAELEKFAYVASHDLQEPLRKIRTFISRLQDDPNLDDDQRRMYMDKVFNASHRMHQLINDVLSFSKVSSGNIAYARTDLNAVLYQVLSDMEVLIEQQQAVINADKLPVVEANETQMSQLLQNFISNAIKFRKDGEVPIITIHSDVLSGAEVKAEGAMLTHYNFALWQDERRWENEQFCRITIADNGIGFDSVYAERIFEAFQRLSHTYEGTGVGLAICQKIADNHHGFIIANGTQGVGATFTIVIPVSQANFGAGR